MKKSLRQRGQILAVGLVICITLISFITYTLYVGYGYSQKIKLQNAADASAYSAAIIQAQVLNCVSILNHYIVLINNIVTKIILVWQLLRVCAAFCFFGFGCACVGPLKVYDRLAKPILKIFEKLAWAMAKVQDSIVQWGKAFVLAEVVRIAKANGASYALPYPYNPKGSLESKSTLGFHLVRADKKEDLKKSGYSDEAIKIATEDRNKLMNCFIKRWNADDYEEAYGYYCRKGFTKSIDWIYERGGSEIKFDTPKGKEHDVNGSGKTYSFSHAQTTECRKVSDLLTMGYKLPNPLVLRDDFKDRQKILVLAVSNPFEGISFLDKRMSTKMDNPFFIALAQARPEGSSIFKMEWTARMESCSLHKEALKDFSFPGSGILKKFVGPFTELINH